MKKLNAAICKKLNELLPCVPVYPVIADEDASLPYVVYTDSSFTVERTKDGPYGQIHDVSVQIWTEQFDQGDDMADTVQDGLVYVIAPGIESLLMSGNSGYQGDAFYQTLNFEIEVDV